MVDFIKTFFKSMLASGGICAGCLVFVIASILILGISCGVLMGVQEATETPQEKQARLEREAELERTEKNINDGFRNLNDALENANRAYGRR